MVLLALTHTWLQNYRNGLQYKVLSGQKIVDLEYTFLFDISIQDLYMNDMHIRHKNVWMKEQRRKGTKNHRSVNAIDHVMKN